MLKRVFRHFDGMGHERHQVSSSSVPHGCINVHVCRGWGAQMYMFVEAGVHKRLRLRKVSHKLHTANEYAVLTLKI